VIGELGGSESGRSNDDRSGPATGGGCSESKAWGGSTAVLYADTGDGKGCETAAAPLATGSRLKAAWLTEAMLATNGGRCRRFVRRRSRRLRSGGRMIYMGGQW
jgi:hypothetical protein